MVSLKRNRRWFLPARYTAVIDAPGYEPTFVPIHSTINPWILGNVVIGGIPGLIVDNATGAAWRPSEPEIHRQLYPVAGGGQEPMVSANEPASRGSKRDPQYVADRGRPVSTSATDHSNAVRPASAP